MAHPKYNDPQKTCRVSLPFPKSIKRRKLQVHHRRLSLRVCFNYQTMRVWNNCILTYTFFIIPSHRLVVYGKFILPQMRYEQMSIADKKLSHSCHLPSECHSLHNSSFLTFSFVCTFKNLITILLAAQCKNLDLKRPRQAENTPTIHAAILATWVIRNILGTQVNPLIFRTKVHIAEIPIYNLKSNACNKSKAHILVRTFWCVRYIDI